MKLSIEIGKGNGKYSISLMYNCRFHIRALLVMRVLHNVHCIWVIFRQLTQELPGPLFDFRETLLLFNYWTFETCFSIIYSLKL